MAKYRDPVPADAEKFRELKALDAECQPLNEKFRQLRDEHLVLCAVQETVSQALHALGKERQDKYDALVQSGLDPRDIAKLMKATA